MKVLLTGANGFLGKIISQGLQGHEVITSDLQCAAITCDLANAVPKLPESIDLVIHCAGKAHTLPKTDEEREVFFKVNYQGTVNLCKALDQAGSTPKSLVLISTVSVYGIESGSSIGEDAPLNGNSSYALSKILAEEYVKSWGEAHNTNILILRLPLVVGANPPGNLGKMISAITRGRFLLIGDGEARKSMVCATDLPELILRNTDKSGTFNLTDGIHPTLGQVELTIAEAGGYKRSPRIPAWFANYISIVGEFLPSFPLKREVFKKMTMDLTFDDQKARTELGWNPSKSLTKLREYRTQ